MHFPVTTLGPGRRLGIWFQGCSIRCSGCISADTWAFKSPDITVDELCGSLTQWVGSASGVTISGGEPFDQAQGLVELVKRLKSMFKGDLLIFTGYSYEQISPQLDLLPGLVDAVISDPFRQDDAQTKALRGSDNQRLHLLTSLGHERLSCYERPRSGKDDALDLMFDSEGSAWIAGIPRRGDMHRLRAAITAAGGRATITQARQK